jgi:hypothetical protein
LGGFFDTAREVLDLFDQSSFGAAIRLWVEMVPAPSVVKAAGRLRGGWPSTASF